MLEWVPLALGRVSAAGVLNYHQIAAQNGFVREIGIAGLVVRRPLQQHRQLLIACGSVDIGAQNHPVARLHDDIVLNDHF
jgi:hypothetical protein